MVQNSRKFTKLSPLINNSYSSPSSEMCTEVPKKSKEEEKRNTQINTSPQMMVHTQNTQIKWQFPTKSKKQEKPESPLTYYSACKSLKQGILELKDENMTYLSFY